MNAGGALFSARKQRHASGRSAIGWLLAGSLLTVFSCAAAGAEIPPALRACTSLTEGASRLSCYDKEIERYRSSAVDRYGLSEAQLRKADPTTEKTSPASLKVAAKLAGVSTRSDGRMIFSLDNRQVWIQSSPEDLTRVENGQEVSIEPGALGSFFLVAGRHQSTRVRRLK